MRCFYMLYFMVLILLFSSINIEAAVNDKQSVIIEVDGDPHKHRDYIEKYYPGIDVVAVYETLLNGLALQASSKELTKIDGLTFVQTTHQVQMYQQDLAPFPVDLSDDHQLPSTFNTTNLTGKGIKVGVIDTGIDYTHPDLAENYIGGYDVVDFDDDPMETTKEQGIPTLHGTHVAGIIAANGKLTGVAPEADIYAYRALGPGGSGSSIQVIAAMERAVKDGVDVMNLSLGNIVNGPDFPTSIAVNKASERGVAVVIANGNNGPNHWTVGAPATATGAIAVGALSHAQNVPYLYAHQNDKKIALTMMQGSLPWIFSKDYQIVSMDEIDQASHGQIVLMKRGDVSFYQKAKKAEKAGAIAVLIYNNEAGELQGSVENEEDPLKIPVAAIGKEDGDWITSYQQTNSLYVDTKYEKVIKGVAPFSSRGPVTMNWALKPDLLAPGTNVLSTIPGGYLALQGTSMAAPYVAGAIALIKEAQPTWSNKQIIAALKTTATQMKTADGQPLEPISQGMGEMEFQEAIHTGTIIDNTLLSIGKVNEYKESKTINLTIENMTNQKKRYSFDMPKQQKGLYWKLPQTFTLAGKEKRTIPIKLDVVTQQLSSGSHQGWLTLHEGDQTFNLPYLLINQTADYPKVMGFGFSLKPFSKDTYTYDLYLTEEAKQIEVNLYDPDTLVYDRRLLLLTDVQAGINKGEIKQKDIGDAGQFIANITIEMKDGSYESYEEYLTIDEHN